MTGALNTSRTTYNQWNLLRTQSGPHWRNITGRSDERFRAKRAFALIRSKIKDMLLKLVTFFFIACKVPSCVVAGFPGPQKISMFCWFLLFFLLLVQNAFLQFLKKNKYFYAMVGELKSAKNKQKHNISNNCGQDYFVNWFQLRFSFPFVLKENVKLIS